jgi:hypothetical protein
VANILVKFLSNSFVVFGNLDQLACLVPQASEDESHLIYSLTGYSSTFLGYVIGAGFRGMGFEQKNINRIFCNI